MHAAAEKLNLSQPSISKAIADLEKYYQIQLFERINHRLYLTPMGEIMLEHAQIILDQFRQMEADISVQGQRNHIRIGASVSVGTYLLPPLIHALTEQKQPISYEATIDNTSKIERLVTNYELDLGLVEGCIENPNLVIRDVAEDELVLVVRAGHPLAKQLPVTNQDLEQYPFVTREDGSSRRNQLELYLQKEGLQLTNNYACSSVEAIKQALIYTDSIAALSHLMITDELKQGVLTVIPREDLKVQRSIRLIYHKHKYMSTAMKTFIQVLENHVEDRANHTTA